MMQKRDVIFAILTSAVVIIFVPYMYYSFKLYVAGRANKPYPEYDWVEMSGLWKTCITATIQIFFKKRLVKYFFGIVQPYAKDKDNKETNAKRSKKAAKYVYSTLMYTFLTSYGYYVMRDSAWLPWYLGGTRGSYEGIWENIPYAATCEGASTYAFVQLGFLAGEFINLLLMKEN